MWAMSGVVGVRHWEGEALPVAGKEDDLREMSDSLLQAVNAEKDKRGDALRRAENAQSSPDIDREAYA